MAEKEAVVDTLSWEGTLSSSDFRVAASAFMEKWKRICSAFPPWSWVLCPKQPWVASHEVSVVNRCFNLPLLQPVHVQKLYVSSLFLYLSLLQVEGYLSLENILLKSSEVWP